MWKSYHAVTSWKYRLVANILLPVLTIVAVQGAKYIFGSQYGLFVGLSLFVVIDLFSEYFFFAGSYKKGCLGMDYLKTSTKGDKMILDTFKMDMIVRAFRSIVVMAGCFNIAYQLIPEWEIWVGATLLLILWDIASENILRYITMVYSVYLVANFISCIGVLMGVGMLFLTTIHVPALLLIAALVLLNGLMVYVSILHAKNIISNSYKD